MLGSADSALLEASIQEEGTTQPKIGLVSYSSLGDGLIYLLIAENLQLNGFKVTYFGDIGYQLRHWIPQLEFAPYPAPDLFDKELTRFDLVVMSPPQFYRNHMDAFSTDVMRKKWLLICLKAPEDWRFDLSDSKHDELSPSIFAALKGVFDSGGPIQYRDYGDESVVDIAVDYLQRRMHLRQVSRHVLLTPPNGLQHRRYRNRIVVSPDSAWPQKKDWPPGSYIRLCRALKAHGYKPVIVVAPANHARWSQMASNAFSTPLFPDIGQLAAFVYESGAVIANDSGNGHLASFLGVPVVTIYRKRNPRFHWRPDWGPGVVVCPRLTLPGPGGPVWKPFVLVRDVLKAVIRIHGE